MAWHFRFLACLFLLLRSAPAPAQVIEYEANGQKYQALTRRGLTVIVSFLKPVVSGMALVQASITNGSDIYFFIKPEGFLYVRNGQEATGVSSSSVVDLMLKRGSSSDVVKLVTSYEAVLYGIPNMRTSNGYEMRRQGAMSAGMPPKYRAAATASAIVLPEQRLAAGQSTDGAVFITLPREGPKSLTGGHLIFRCGSETFEFNPN